MAFRRGRAQRAGSSHGAAQRGSQTSRTQPAAKKAVGEATESVPLSPSVVEKVARILSERGFDQYKQVQQ